MTQQDLLKQATRALRESAETRSEHADDTRHRVVETLLRGKKRRRNTAVLVAVIAVTLLASTAGAAFTGQLPVVMQALRQGVDDLFGLEEESAAEADSPSPVARGMRSGAQETPEVQRLEGLTALDEEEPVAPLPVEEPSPLPSEEVSLGARPVPPIPPTPDPSPDPDDVPPVPAGRQPLVRPPSSPPSRPALAPAEATSEPEIESDGLPAEVDALYRRAHRLHFVERNPRAALAAWDRYLSSEPRGRFALEARYNRAITLVRLGRRQAAIAALRPFADGVYRGYRQREARQLISALEQVAGSPDP